MANVPIISFNAGLISPQIDKRSDIEKHSSGCKVIQNMIPTVFGPAERRPGAMYIWSTKDNGKALLVDFIYSSEIAYQVEFGNLYCRFFYDGAILTDDGEVPDATESNVVEVTTPYLLADIFEELQFKQSNDTMWITSNNYPPYKLTRTTATSFSLDEIEFNTGPFLKRRDLNEADGITMTPAATTGTTTMSASAAYFTTDRIGSLLKLVQPRKDTQVSLTKTFSDTPPTGASLALKVKGDWTFNTSGIWTGTVAIERSENGGDWETYRTYASTANRNIQLSATEESDNVEYRVHVKNLVVNSDASITSTITADVTVSNPIQEGICRIIAPYINTTSANIEVLEDFAYSGTSTVLTGSIDPAASVDVVGVGTKFLTELSIDDYIVVSGETRIVDTITDDTHLTVTVAFSNNANDTSPETYSPKRTTLRWYEGAWSYARGYPKCFTMFGGRGIYLGSIYEPQNVWFSEVGDYENFEEGTKDADAFSFTIDSDDRSAIKWATAAQYILVGTSSTEYMIRASAYDQPITPTNFTVRPQADRGSASIQAINTGDSVLFIDAPKRKVREISFDSSKDKYTTFNLVVMCEEITESGIVDWAKQKNPDTIIWCVLTDGTLISLSFDREQNIIAWAEHYIGGTDVVVESVSVIPSSSEDEIWISVRRTINGSTVRYIEQMQPRKWGTEQKDCFFVDSGLVYDGVSTTTLSGLDHLEGETVKINSNGVEVADKVVSGGSITLDEATTYAIVGLSNTYILAPMSLELPNANGSASGSIKKIPEVCFSFLNSLDVQFGASLTDLKDFDFQTTEGFGDPPMLFTGDRPESYDGGFEISNTIYITGNGIWPCTVRAIIPRVQKTGR